MPRNFLAPRPDTFDYQLDRVCANCGSGFQGRYCSNCGEKVIEPHERSFIYFLDGLLNAFTFIEGKFVRTIRLMLTNPGMLSRHMAEGRRVPYMKPLSVFFVANFFYFLFFLYDSYNSRLVTQMTLMGPHSELATNIVNNYLAKTGMTLEEFTVVYESTSVNLAKLFIVVIVVWFAGVLWAFNLRKKVFFFDHLNFSLEVYAFNLLFNLLFVAWSLYWLSLLGSAMGLDWSALNTDLVFSSLASLVIGYYIARAQRTFYGDGRLVAIVKGIALMAMTSLLIQLYRVVLFHLTMLFI